MSSPLTMFHETDGDWSMSRVVIFMFAIVICRGLWVVADRDHLHDMGIPFAALAGVVALAIPIKALFTAFVEWFKSTPAQALLQKLITKVATGPLSIASDAAAVTTTTTVGEQG